MIFRTGAGPLRPGMSLPRGPHHPGRSWTCAHWLAIAATIMAMSMTHVTAIGDPGDVLALQSLASTLPDIPSSWDRQNLDPCSGVECPREPCPSAWQGVSCSGGRVVGITLSGSGSPGPGSPTLPAALANATQLHQLQLRGLGLTGTIPPGLGALASLVSLDLNFNQLTGSIPVTLGSLDQLQYLGLQQNRLTGQLPPSLAGCGSLRMLQLSANELSGSLPDAWGGLQSLVVLDLDGNQLSGRLPPQWFRLQGLSMVHLASNQLLGPFPTSWQAMSNLSRMDVSGNCGLCGPPLDPPSPDFQLDSSGTGLGQSCDTVDCHPPAGARQWAPIIVACVLGLFLLLVIPLAIFVIRRSLRQHAARVDAARAGADPGDAEKAPQETPPFHTAELFQVAMPDGARVSMVCISDGLRRDEASTDDEAAAGGDPLDPVVFPVYQHRGLRK
ncbi:hypothetical protein ACKKBG_A04810 [Auxenochlorella protothecoides x Auxenochlorella symbiontica]